MTEHSALRRRDDAARSGKVRSSAAAPPFFIIGFQRSGTTLLRVMLDSHPNVAVPLDTVGLWRTYYQRLGEYGYLRSGEDLDRMIGDLLVEERIALWEAQLTVELVKKCLRGDGFPAVMDAFYRAYASLRGKRRWGDKDPGNMNRVHLLDEWFPDARFLHIIRDGRDACSSLCRQEFGPDELLSCAESWREQVWWVRAMGRVLGPTRYCELRYEDLVTQPEVELRSVADFLGINFSSDMLHYHEKLGNSVPASRRHLWPLLEKPPQPSNVGRWRSELPTSARVCFEKRAGSLLEELGYEVLPEAPTGAYVEELRFLLRKSWRAVHRRVRRRFGAQ